MAGGGKVKGALDKLKKVTRRDVLKGMGAGVITAAAAGKAGMKGAELPPGAALKQIDEALSVPIRDLSKPFAKNVFSKKEWDIVSEWLDAARIQYEGQLQVSKEIGASPDDGKMKRVSETLYDIIRKDKNEPLTKWEYDIFAEMIEDAAEYSQHPKDYYPEGHPGQLFEDQFEILDNVERELYTPLEAVGQQRAYGYEVHPNPDPEVRQVFEDIITDGRIWDDRAEYGLEDFASSYFDEPNATKQAKQLMEMLEMSDRLKRDGFAGGGAVKAALKRQWRIWDTHTKEYVSSPYNNKKRATTRMDKLDNEYGAYRYQVKEVTDKEGKAGGGKIRKFNRRDVLKGMGAVGATGLAGMKAGTKVTEPGAALKQIEEALDIGGKTRPFAAWSKQDMSPRQWATIDKYLLDKLDDLEEVANDLTGSATKRESIDDLRMDFENVQHEMEQIEHIRGADPEYVFDPSAQEYLEGFVEDTVSDLNLEIHDYGDFDNINDPRVTHIREMERLLPPTRTPAQLGGDRTMGGLGPREKKAGGGKIKKALGNLREGPGAYDAAMAAAKAGDTERALEYLRQLQELLQLSDEDFSKMIGQGVDREPQMKFNPATDPDLDTPVGGYKEQRALGSPMRLAAGGKIKGNLIKANEWFARNAGKRLNEDLEIPEGFATFYTQKNPKGSTSIIGVRSDGSEQTISTIAGLFPGDKTEDFAKELAGAYNTRGFSDSPISQIPIEEAFGKMDDGSADITRIQESTDTESLKSMKKILQDALSEGGDGEMGELDLGKIMQMLDESEFDPAGKTVKNSAGEISKVADLRRMSVDEIHTLQERGILGAEMASDLADQVIDIESEFADIIMDMEGEWPDEVHIVPDPLTPEVYEIKAKFLDSNREKYYAFDPETGPREAPEIEKGFRTIREELMPDLPEKDTPRKFEEGEYDPARLGSVSSDQYMSLRRLLDDYSGNSLEDYEIYPDPNRPGMFAAKAETERGTFGFIIDTNADDVMDAVEEVEFVDWPPKPRKGYAEGGRARKEPNKALQYLRAVGRSLAGAIPGTGENEHQLGEDIGSQMYRKGALPVAGFKSQWYGVDPDTQNFVYAGPFSGDDSPGMDAIPGIIDETMLLPSMPQMIEELYDYKKGKFEDPNYEGPDIPAPQFALDAADRANVNWDESLRSVGLDPETEGPKGFVENSLISGGMMLGQLPVPTSWFGRARNLLPATKSGRVDRVLKQLAEEAGDKPGILSQIAGSGPEFLFPTIDPKTSNYIAGSLFGGTLMTALDPGEAEEIEQTMDPQIASLLDQFENGTPEEREEARKILQAILDANTAEESEGFAGGGKIRKFNRRDVLKGLGAAGVTGAAAGKAGMKVTDPGAALKQIEEALSVPPAAIKKAVPGNVGAPWRKIIDLLEIESKEWPGDIEMKEMYEGDVADYEYIAKSMEEGKLKAAVKRYDSLDTAAREMIYDVDHDTTIALRRQLGKAGSDYDSLDWDDLDVGEQEIILGELETAYEDGGLTKFDEVESRLPEKWGVNTDGEDFSEYFEFLDEPEGYAGGGKIRKFNRRDVLKGIGAAGVTGAAMSKAGMKVGVDPDVAFPAIKKALAPAVADSIDPTAIFSLDQLPKKSRDTVMEWMDLYLENWEQLDPEAKADAGHRRYVDNIDYIRDELGTGDPIIEDMAMHYEQTKDFEGLIEMARDDAIDTPQYQLLDDALQSIKGAKALSPEEFFQTLQKSALDRPSAFDEWQERMGVPTDDWIELPMRGELGDNLTGTQLKKIADTFPEGEIPETLMFGHWDT